MSMYNFQLYSTVTTKMASKPSRAAPPPPIPHHADSNNNKSRRTKMVLSNNQINLVAGKVPTVIRPKMVETTKKLAPPRPPPPSLDASFIPTRTSSLGRGVPPPVPPPPKNKPSIQKGLKQKANALRKVKLFGKSSRSCTTNANEEFYTASMSSGGFGRSYTNQALASSKRQAPLPPQVARNSDGIATGTLISFDSPPTSPGIVAPAMRPNFTGQNVQSLLDLDFPEPDNGGSLLDMDIPPMISQSLSVDNFGSTPFDPFVPQSRKSSLPVTSVSPMVMKTTPQRRISQIREEFSSPAANSPPPPKCPAPQLNDPETSAISTQPCAMALIDCLFPIPGHLSFSQYDLIELIADHDERSFRGRFEESEGLVDKQHVEVLTPLDSSFRGQATPEPSGPIEKKEDDPRLLVRSTSSDRHSKPIASVQPFSTTRSDDIEVTALYDFEAQQDDELSFKAGDRLIVTSRCDQDWYTGYTTHDSRCGIFPSAFVQIDDDIDIKGSDALKCEIIEQKEGTEVVAVHTFVPEQDGDLAFEEGDTLIVLSRINKDWLMGRNAKGQEGQFPASFIQSPNEKDCEDVSVEETLHVALYDFEAQQEEDLAFREGDKIQVTKRVADEWWQGHVLGDTKEGLFPANFVEPL